MNFISVILINLRAGYLPHRGLRRFKRTVLPACNSVLEFASMDIKSLFGAGES